MELLIPGLILVALMAWASTKIKKRAAEAFEAETIDTSDYSLEKPEGFLHVIGSRDHEFEAYSKEFDESDFRLRRGKIEIDVLTDGDLKSVCDEVRSGTTDLSISDGDRGIRWVECEEAANENAFKVFYKIVDTPRGIYRLRFAVISKHVDDYLRRINETLDSFRVKTT